MSSQNSKNVQRPPSKSKSILKHATRTFTPYQLFSPIDRICQLIPISHILSSNHILNPNQFLSTTPCHCHIHTLPTLQPNIQDSSILSRQNEFQFLTSLSSNHILNPNQFLSTKPCHSHVSTPISTQTHSRFHTLPIDHLHSQHSQLTSTEQDQILDQIIKNWLWT